jgi:hypothetical protein
MGPKKLEPAAVLRDALQVLSRSDVERAWTAASAAHASLGSSNPALRAEMAAFLMASILSELGSATTRHDDLSDVLPAVESLALYVAGRMAVIVADSGNSS